VSDDDVSRVRLSSSSEVTRDSWRSSFGTPQRPRSVDGHALWTAQAGWHVAGFRTPRRVDYVLVCPKMAPLDRWWAARPPRAVAAVYAVHLGDPRLAAVLRSLCPRGSRAVFVGDMDPVGIAPYLAAKAMLRAARGPALLHGGMNHEWLASIRRSLRPPRVSEEDLRIPLDKDERRLWQRLETDSAVDQLVGPEACRILRSGYKLELEAASSPEILTSRHKQWVFRYLRSISEREA
jgi:hypothetical protein